MKKSIKALALTGAALLAAKGLDNRLEVTHYVMRSKKIPKNFNEFRILQISDYHNDNFPGLVDAIKGEVPDIIVSTGDLVHDRGSYIPGVRLMERLVKIAPVYAVTGNHDVWRTDYNDFEAELNSLGVVTLHDEQILLEIDGERIALSGMDDPFSRDGMQMLAAVKCSLSSIEPYNGYNILLFHRANLLDHLCGKGFDLILTGHMHGGQFRLPNGRGVVSPKSGWGSDSPLLFPKYFAGHYHKKDTEMIVNRGIGNPMLIPRVFNRPEITVITLKNET